MFDPSMIPLLFAELKEPLIAIEKLVDEGAVDEIARPILKILERVYEASIDSELPELAAEDARAKFQAFIDAGFTEEQSFQLLLKQRQDTSEILRNIKLNSNSTK